MKHSQVSEGTMKYATKIYPPTPSQTNNNTEIVFYSLKVLLEGSKKTKLKKKTHPNCKYY